MVKPVILLLKGLSNQFEPSMVFDPSEFEAPRFFLLRQIGKIEGTFKSVRAIHGIWPHSSSRHQGLTILLEKLSTYLVIC